jgi:hypothetical protein
MKRAALLALACVACVACAPQYVARPGVSRAGNVFEQATGPLSYQSPTARDVARTSGGPRTVRGESCQHAIVFPVAVAVALFQKPAATEATPAPSLGVAWGDGGYVQALEEARAAAGGAELYDVRADAHVTAILGIYVRRCLEVHAEVASR